MSRDPRELVFPGPLRDYPRPLAPSDLTLLGAKPYLCTGADFVAGKQVSNVPCLITMITLMGGAAASVVRIFDSANGGTAITERIGGVQCAASGYDGWSHSRGVIAYKGLVVQLSAADLEVYVYLITATG